MDWTKLEGIGLVAFNVFTPGELETATGLTADMQRVWRRRGQLLACDGARARFNADQVAAIAVRFELARFGVSPSETTAIGERAARTVLHSALLSRSRAAQVRGPFDEVATVAATFANDHRLADVVAGADGSGRYLIALSPSDFEFVDDVASLLSDEGHSAILILDLTVVGIRLADRSPKPLFIIDVGRA
ncbi:hypothetical protein ACPVPU_03410 [Sphingomonas sp. CJ99]